VADKRKRFTSYIIDQLFVIGFGLLFGTLIGLTTAFFAPERLGLFVEENRLFNFGLAILMTLVYFSFLKV